MDTKLYINFVKNALKTNDTRTVDIMNKMALEMKQITIEQYLKAAREINKVFLAQ